MWKIYEEVGYVNGDRRLCQEAKAFRQYDKTITKSLAEEPTEAGIFLEVDAVLNHRSTKLCSCKDGSTGRPRHIISTCQ